MIDNSLSKEIRSDIQSKHLHVMASSVGTNSWCKKFIRVDVIKTIQTSIRSPDCRRRNKVYIPKDFNL